jgi:SAM-dependent methyltransferase
MERGPAAFDRFAEDWDDRHGPASPRAAEFRARVRLLRRLVARPGGGAVRMLELGCGTGLNLVALADALAEGVGVDFSPAMIARARRNADQAQARNLRFVRGDAAEAPFPAGSFDLVLLAGTLEHLPDRGAALERCRTLLAEGGRVVVVAPHPRSPALLWQRLVRGGAGRQFAQDLHLAPRGLAALARRHGLEPAGLHALPCLPAHDGEEPPPGWVLGALGLFSLLPVPAARGAFALVLEKA